MKFSIRGTAKDTTRIEPGDLLHLYFTFYNVPYIGVFAKIPTVV